MRLFKTHEAELARVINYHNGCIPMEDMNMEVLKYYTSDFRCRMELRKVSLESLLLNFKEEYAVRRCLHDDNMRLLKQAITGRRVGF